MPSFLQPDPVLLAFIPIKQGLFLLALLPLALIRALVARSAARGAGLLALALALLGLAATYLPGLLGLTGGVAVAASGWQSLWGGLGMNFAASAALLASAVLPGRSWWGIDAVHLLLLAGFVGLWVYTLL